MRRLGFVFIALIAAGTVLSAQQPAPKNLKVLPKEMTRQEVRRIMQSFTTGLGVRCTHCHAGEDPSQLDYASDAKPTKEVARKMLAMVVDINTKHLAGVGEPPAAGANKVTCYTCHRGTTKPLTAPPPAAPGIAALMQGKRR
jgi:hypothetical protein